MTTTHPEEVDLKELPAGSVVKFHTKHGSEYEVITSGTTLSNLTSQIDGLLIKSDSDLADLDPARQGQYRAFSMIKKGTFWIIEGGYRTSTIVDIELTTPDR